MEENETPQETPVEQTTDTVEAPVDETPVEEIAPAEEHIEAPVDETPDPEPEEVETVETEMKVDHPRHQNLFADPMYIGHPNVDPNNPLLIHADPATYESNKNKENR